ncbi:hypothetical protein DBN73_17105 [Enterococcus faecalis]|nr:hypothetical protein [Enterococcus faecalis]
METEKREAINEERAMFRHDEKKGGDRVQSARSDEERRERKRREEERRKERKKGESTRKGSKERG